MNRYMDWNKGMQVLILSAVIGIALNPAAFKRWASNLHSEQSRKPLLDFATGLDSALEYFGTGFAAGALRTNFLSFSRDYRFTFIQNPEPPSSQLFNSPLLVAPVETGVNRAPAVVTAVASPAPSPSPEPSPSPVPSPTPAPAAEKKPLTRALFLGDSLLKTVLETRIKQRFLKEFPGASLDSFAKISTGIARPDIFDWEKKVSEFSAKGHVDAIFLFLGTNDNQSIYQGTKEFPFFTEKWKAIYLARVRALLEKACGYSGRVFWVAVPPVRDPAFNEDMTQLNALIAQGISKDSKLKDCALPVPSAPALTGPQGSFTSYLQLGERVLKIREKDGIHLTFDGAELLAAHLAELTKNEFRPITKENP